MLIIPGNLDLVGVDCGCRSRWRGSRIDFYETSEPLPDGSNGGVGLPQSGCFEEVIKIAVELGRNQACCKIQHKLNITCV